MISGRLHRLSPQIFGWTAFAFLICFFTHADTPDETALKKFGQDYAAAIHTQKIDRILPFFDPVQLRNLSPQDQKTVSGWFDAYCQGPAQFGGAVKVQVKKLANWNPPPAWGKWLVAPQYQIILQGESAPKADGSKQVQFMMDFAAKKKGRFYIVRPFPTGPLPPPTVVTPTPVSTPQATPVPSVFTPSPVPTPH